MAKTLMALEQLDLDTCCFLDTKRLGSWIFKPLGVVRQLSPPSVRLSTCEMVRRDETRLIVRKGHDFVGVQIPSHAILKYSKLMLPHPNSHKGRGIEREREAQCTHQTSLQSIQAQARDSYRRDSYKRSTLRALQLAV